MLGCSSSQTAVSEVGHFWDQLYKRYWIKSQERCMWWSPLLWKPTGHDWGRKNASIWLRDAVGAPGASGAWLAPPSSSNRLSLAADRTHTMQHFLLCSGWHIYVSSTRYYIASDIKGGGAVSPPVVADLWVIAAGFFGSFWGVFAHRARLICAERKSCAWFVLVCHPAKLLYCW